MSTTAPAQGHKAFLGVGPAESTPGSFEAPTQKIEIINWNVAPVIGVIQDSSMYNAISRRGIYQGGLLYRGTFTVRMNYTGKAHLQLLRWVFGSYAATGTGPYTHTFKEGTLTTRSFEFSYGHADGTVFRLIGSKPTGFRLSGTAGQGNDAMLQLEFTVLASTYTGGHAATGGLSFPAVNPVLYHQAGTVDDGTAGTDAVGDVRVRSFEVSYEQPHTEDRNYFGALNIDTPLRSDFATPRWRFTQEFITRTVFDLHSTFTQASPNLVFTSSPHSMTIRSNAAHLVGYTPPVDGFGPVISTSEWEAVYDATDTTALAMIVVNADTSL